jgi:hypothetical protein
MNISPDEAATALKEIEASRSAIRRAIQSRRGHLYLWLWGCIWIAMSVLNWIYDSGALHAIWWLSGIGLVATFAIGSVQARQVRARVDKRFMSVCAILLAFGYLVWPFLVGDLHHYYGFQSYKGAYGYFTVLWMQLYMVAGVWFDRFWFWLGLLVTVLVVGTLMFAPALFWAVTLLFGFVLLGSGFGVRYFWR